MNAAARIPATFEGERITPGQRRKLFVLADERGMSIDDVRDMTPAGSISALSRAEAAALLDRLSGGADFQEHRRARPRGPRRPKGVSAMATDAQRSKIESLRIDLEWTPEGLVGFLSERHYSHGGPMANAGQLAILTTADGIEVIELLKSVVGRQATAAARRRTSDAGSRPDDGAHANVAAISGGVEAASIGDQGPLEGH